MRLLCFILIACAVLHAPATAVAAAVPVEFELITEPGFPITGAQRWVQALQRIGIQPRIRQGQPGETGRITNHGSERSPRYHVKGILTSASTLKVPGGTFSTTDMARLQAWVNKLQGDGIEGLLTRTGSFGLTPKQLADLHQRLSVPVSFATKGVPAREVAGKIVRTLNLEVVATGPARTALQNNELLSEDLMGIASGTVLAASLRPLGLVAVPRRETGSPVKIWIVDARSASEVWPVGWPPDKPPAKTAPKLFEFLNAEIDDYSLADALEAIGNQINVPLLMDHNALARHGVDPTQARVSFPNSRTFYKKVIDRLLTQTKPRLKSELRVDEAGQPFLWITTTVR